MKNNPIIRWTVSIIISLAVVFVGYHFYAQRKAINDIKLDFQSFFATMPSEGQARLASVPKDKTIATTTIPAWWSETRVLGMSIKTPWGVGTEDIETKDNPTTKQISFWNGVKILVTVTSKLPFDDLQGDFNKKEVDQFKTFLGESLTTQYGFAERLFYATPADLVSAKTLKDAQGVSTLLTLKALTITESLEWYRFTGNNIRGFESLYEGDLASVQTFNNNSLYGMYFSKIPKVTDLDAIISSIRFDK